MKRILLSVPLAAFLIAGCAVSANDFASSYDAADAKRKEAAALGYEWRDTGKFLKQAAEANEAGDTEKAMKLVAKAMEQSNDAIAQAERESTAWMSRVPQ